MALAGCLGNSENGSTPDDGNGDGNGDPGGDATEPPGESAYGVSVEVVADAELDERFDIGNLDHQPDAVSDALQAALDGGYETQSVEEALARFVTRHEFARVNGTYVELEPEFPEEVLTLEAVDSAGIDDADVVGARTFRQDEAATDAIATAISHGEAREFAFPAFLHDLVAEYEYVTPTDMSDDDPDVYAWSIERDDRGGPPYTLAASQVSESTVFGDDVVDYGHLLAESQVEFDAALADGRQVDEDRPALLDDGAPFIRYDGAVYRVAIDVAN